MPRKKKASSHRKNKPTSKVDLRVARKVLEVVNHGLVCGVGEPEPGKMCVEAAVCYAMGQPHGDQPKCVAESVRSFKISLNDSDWSSNKARAKGLRRIAIAQLGSKGVVKDSEFARLIAEKTIRKVVPIALRAAAKLNPTHAKNLEDAAIRCEQEGTKEAADAARSASDAASYAASYAARYASDAASSAARSASSAASYAASSAARYASDAASSASSAASYAASYASDAARSASSAARYAASYAASSKQKSQIKNRILTMSAELGIEVLRELKAPGVVFMDRLVPLKAKKPTTRSPQKKAKKKKISKAKR